MARKNWISAVAASAALMMTSPLMAADASHGGAGTSLASASTAASAGTVAAKKKPAKYCVDTHATGSRIAKRVCQTSDEWAREGVDIKREMKKR